MKAWIGSKSVNGVADSAMIKEDSQIETSRHVHEAFLRYVLRRYVLRYKFGKYLSYDVLTTYEHSYFMAFPD
jgi:hypothetical protein